MSKPDFVPSLINSEPPVFAGLTLEALKLIIITRLIASLVINMGLVTLIYPHMLVYLGALISSFALTVALVKHKARKVLISQRGKDMFYSEHVDAIALERIRRRIARWGGYELKAEHSFFVKDKFWSQR
jgi:type IV secretory pathway VirB3-like protein